MKHVVHALLGAFAMALVATFIATTIYVELFGPAELIGTIKSLIVYPGLLLLIPSLAATGALGMRLAPATRGERKYPLDARVQKKAMRMRIIAANGVLLLIPCALFLKTWALAQDFGATFYIVQGVEIIAGLTNFTLLTLNMRDGLSLRRERNAPATPFARI